MTSKSATTLAALIAAREVSPVEVLEAHLRRIEALNPRLNAIVTFAPDALVRAREAERALLRGEMWGALHGVPFTIKDTIDTRGLRTTCGSALLIDNVPVADAPAVASLKAAGAIILGKTNTAEMALTYEAVNPVFGRTNNPHDLSLTAGGSSGGEAAAIAACLSPAGLGSDLMGSIRVPAHFCGIYGLKPTAGLVSCVGHTPPAVGALALGACVGPMARCVADLKLLLGALAGADAGAAPSIKAADDAFDLRGTRAAWYAADGVAPVSRESREAVERVAGALAEAGLVVEEMRPPGVERAPALWTRLFAGAALAFLRQAYAGREELAGADASFLLSQGSGTEPQAPEDYAEALKERERLRVELLEWMKRTPLIVAPVGATNAFTHGARKVQIEGQALSVFRSFSYSQTYNVFGLPSVAVPALRAADGLPMGVQIIGRPFAEASVLAAAGVVERVLGGWTMPAALV